jgi:hypothetical protein
MDKFELPNENKIYWREYVRKGRMVKDAAGETRSGGLNSQVEVHIEPIYHDPGFGESIGAL